MAGILETSRRAARAGARRGLSVLLGPARRATRRDIEESASRQEAQVLLQLKYRELATSGVPLPPISDFEFKSLSSQAGIYLWILTVIGMTTRLAVEICAGDGIHCSSSNLIVNHGYTGLLVDARKEILRAAHFYRRFDWIHPPSLACRWVTRDNVNDVIASAGPSAMFTSERLRGEVDVLTLDMDGVDYWIWQAIEAISPRLFVCEYNTALGCDAAVTVPYDNDFRGTSYKGILAYGGASLAAFVQLCRTKGYRLVGCDRRNYNAYFLRNDVGQKHFPEVGADACFGSLHARFARAEIWPGIRDREWVRL